MRNFKFGLILAVLLILMSGCTLDDSGPFPEEVPSTTVLFQSGFESNGAPDLISWHLYYEAVNWGNDTLVSASCANGGSFALNLEADRLQRSYAEAFITQLSGPRVMLLSFKAMLFSGQNSITATLAQIRGGTVLRENEFALGTWNDCLDFGMTANMDLMPTDSVRIRFVASGSSYERSQVQVDEVMLKMQ